MRKDFGAKAYLYPQPVLVIATYGKNNVPNAMVAAWGSCADYDKVSIHIAKSHKTMENILARKAFTVTFGDVAHVKQVDYLGVVSGNDVEDKLKKSGLLTEKAPHVDAPLLTEFPLTLECTLDSYDEESEVCIATVVNATASENVLTSDGKIDPLKLNVITYDPVHFGYIALGEKVGTAFHDGRSL